MTILKAIRKAGLAVIDFVTSFSLIDWAFVALIFWMAIP